VRELANPADVMTLSAREPDSLAPWCDWLREHIEANRAGARMQPKVQADGVKLHGGA